MSWKALWNDWKWTAATLVLCLGAYGIHTGAWYAGYGANALGLLGLRFLGFFVLLLAWGVVATLLKYLALGEEFATRKGVRAVDVGGGFLLIGGCLGCYLGWPLVLFLLAVALLQVIALRKNTVPAAGAGWTRWDLLRVGLPLLLFTPTWYWYASASREGLRGLGARIEDRAGSDRLLAWAGDVVAEHDRRERARPVVVATAVGLPAADAGPFLAAPALALVEPEWARWELSGDQVPAWVDDLLGRFQGVRSVRVENYGYGRCVVLRTGGSAYHLRISVFPSRPDRGTRPWWLGADESEWRPGIYVESEGK